jgi:hypothetical protein
VFWKVAALERKPRKYRGHGQTRARVTDQDSFSIILRLRTAVPLRNLQHCSSIRDLLYSFFRFATLSGVNFNCARLVSVHIRPLVPPESHQKCRTEQELQSIIDFSVRTIGMFTKGFETGFLGFHPLALGLPHNAAARLTTARPIATSNVGNANFLIMSTVVYFSIYSTCAAGIADIIHKRSRE